MTPCQHCSAPAEVSLCWECTRLLGEKLRSTLWLADELQVDVTRQAVKSAGSEGRAAETPLVFGAEASEAAAVLTNTVAVWLADLDPAEALTTDCQRVTYLIAHVLDIARLPDAGVCLDDFIGVVELGMRVVDRPPERTYLTDCGCGRRVCARDEDLVVECACGCEFDVSDHRAANRTGARDMLVSAREASRLLGDVYGRNLDPATVRQWAHRGKLAAADQDGTEKLYRLGDILDLCQSRGPSIRRS